ncbi:MAG: fused MFS/spermidine synthase [Betaproteobacteria bacterium]|nr:fused MFS/spermidine synthase [Betaproteobacteria bacterium]MDH5221451.1 fused MFS/spermidine synthase [Betaproteobacteria bacterium]MDH5351726.1 fused MFS/spermidine synthase [Betaproteobacteria bacterium]
MSRRPALTVSEERGVRTLHVGGEAIQSSMRLSDPFALELDYTRCMMSFLLFHPRPRRALKIGLGGGSLVKFFWQRLPGLRTRVVELDERVVRVAREQFHLPPDDARLAIEVGDGAEALAPECCDLLVVDAFADEHPPAALVSQAFFDAAWLALEEPGVLVLNLMNDDPRLDERLQRVERAFGGAALALPALYDPNVLVFALKGAPARLAWDELARRAHALERRFGLPFPRYVPRLKRMNRFDAEALIIVPQGGRA